jgi:threonine aldolase
VANQPDGKLALEDIEAAVRSDNVHFPRTRLIILENTHNLCNGFPLDTNYMRAVGEIAERYNLKIHVDGARFFNAAVALDIDPKNLAAEADSVSFCLSKGLGAPVGSVVCGTQDFIHEARRARKVLGGGMRQAGVIAAAGIVALNPTNIIFFEVNREDMTPAEFVQRIDAEGIRILPVPTGPNALRAVTHYHITSADIDQALGVISKVMK